MKQLKIFEIQRILEIIHDNKFLNTPDYQEMIKFDSHRLISGASGVQNWNPGRRCPRELVFFLSLEKRCGAVEEKHRKDTSPVFEISANLFLRLGSCALQGICYSSILPMNINSKSLIRHATIFKRTIPTKFSPTAFI